MVVQTAANQSRFHFRVGGTPFRVAAFQAREGISDLYRVKLSLATEEEIAPEAMLGQTGLLIIDSDEKERFFHGIVNQCRRTDRQGRFNCYDAMIVPQAALLDLRHDCRIFQNLDVTGILVQVFGDAGISADAYSLRLQGKYPRRDYCVQYRESDLHFVRRLLAEEGIFFFFEHGPDYHRMIFGDSTVCYPSLAVGDRIPFNPGAAMVADREAVLTLQRGRRITSGRYVQRDFNFQKPALELTSSDQCEPFFRLERYDYPGLYALPEEGRRLARVRLQQAEIKRDRTRGRSVVARFTPGSTFFIEDDEDKVHHLLQTVIHTGEQPQVLAERSDPGPGTRYHNDFVALPADTSFRPPLLKKPTVQGIQTAIVTGPQGEEIYTDRHGRVKVRFHWDRRGCADERSSCWLRVSQGWAGAGWGAMFIPRVGQEVVVDFLEGDPDRPVITGRAFHGENPPPYDLPAHQSVSTFKSLSTPGGGGFNEIRFEDRNGHEQIFVHAQRDMDLQVHNDRRTRIDADDHVRIEKDLVEEIRGSVHRTVHTDSIQQVDGSVFQSVGRDRQEKIAGHYGLSSQRQIHLDAGTELVISAGKALTLKAGAGFLTIDAGGVSLCGPRIKLNSGGSPGAGRGCFVQTPLRPQEIKSMPAGQTLAPIKGLSDDLTLPSERGETPVSPVFDNLAANFVHPKTVADSQVELSARLKTTYEIDGPVRIEKQEPPSSGFAAIWDRNLPAGEYALNLNGFSLDAAPIKKPAKRQS